MEDRLKEASGVATSLDSGYRNKGLCRYDCLTLKIGILAWILWMVPSVCV